MPLITIHPTERIVDLPAGSSLTSLEDDALGEGLIAFGCRAGSCGSCVVTILAGVSALDPPDVDERAFLDDLGHAGGTSRLACQCRVRGDLTILLTPSDD